MSRKVRGRLAATAVAITALLLGVTTASAVTLRDGDIIVNDNDGTIHRILRLDPATAAPTQIASLSFNVRGIAMDLSGSILVTGRGQEGGPGAAKVLRINAATGGVAVVTTDGLLSDPQDVVVLADGSLVVSDAIGGVVRVSSSGAQTRLAANAQLLPGNLNGPSGITTDQSGQLLVANRNTVDRGVLRMDPVTGSYSTVASNNSIFSIPLGIAVESDGRILVAENNAPGGGGVIRVDPAGGTAVNISPGTNPFDVAVERTGTILTVTASSTARMFRVDPVTGARTPFLTDFQIAPFALTVVRLNRPPVATDDGTYVTTGDALLTVPAATGLLANDTDPDGDALTASLTGNATNGHVTLAADGSFTYQPTTGFRGVDSFTYTADDGAASSPVATVTIRVNAAPVAVPDGYDVQAGELLTVAAPGVLTNDTDPDGDGLTATFIDPPQGFTGRSDGSFTYQPSVDVAGTVTVGYCTSDGIATTCASVAVSVTPANVAPTAAPDSFVVAQDGQLTEAAPGVLTNDSDGNGDTLTAVLTAGSTHGALQFNADGSFVYTPTTGFSGTDSFTYVATDGRLGSVPTAVTITVTPRPVGLSIADVAVVEGNRRTATLVFTLTRTGPLDQTVRVDYRTVDGTATAADHDYRAKSGSLRLRPGVATTSIEVTVLSDQKVEPNEVLSVVLENASGASIVDGNAIGTIVNDD